MEGMLWKWTNYFNGWQPRWFVLDNGILSYYRSKEDMCSGCKGSLKISVCDVSVHSTDASRLDLIIPGEAHFYLKAATPQERQRWLVALGTAKACLANCVDVSTLSPGGGFSQDALKVKSSELRLYCDLLMQQVHGVKCAVEDRETPDLEKLKESSSLLSATCDTFIETLEDCMHLATGSSHMGFTSGDITHHMSTPSGHRGVGAQRSMSLDRYSPTAKISSSAPISWLSEPFSISSTTPMLTRHHNHHVTFSELSGKLNFSELQEDHDTSTNGDSSKDSKLPTFFTNMPVSFLDVHLTHDGEIPTVAFLDASRSGVKIFDKLNATAFAPAKLDVAGNIKKVHQKYVSNPDAFDTLQKMLSFELHSEQSHLSSSATEALVWLNRSLQFINEFLVGFITDPSADDLTAIVNTAYCKTLADHHGWVIRGAFAMAINSAPTRKEFLASLASDATHINTSAFEQSVMSDITEYSSALTSLTLLLDRFFAENNSDFVDCS